MIVENIKTISKNVQSFKNTAKKTNSKIVSRRKKKVLASAKRFSHKVDLKCYTYLKSSVPETKTETENGIGANILTL